MTNQRPVRVTIGNWDQKSCADQERLLRGYLGSDNPCGPIELELRRGNYWAHSQILARVRRKPIDPLSKALETIDP